MMKKNLEEMQVKVANKRAILESHDGEEFSPITVAKNVLCEDDTTMQDYFDNHSEPNISTKIVNSNSMSKVGQGDNVDFSDNVMNGAYESMVLKGKSMVNCIQEPSSQDVVLPYEFEDGQYVTINDTKEDGALGVELKGQTLVNLVPNRIIDHTASSDWDGYCCLVQNSKQSIDQWRTLQDLKPNTKYYISCYVETFEDATNKDYCLNNPSVESIFGDSMIINGVGRYQWLSTTKSELTDEIFIALRCQNGNARGAIKIKNIMLIEYQEGMENLDIPYFEGMQSVKMPTLSTVGKNLFDGKFELGSISMDTGAEVAYNGAVRTTYIKVKPNTTYCISRSVETTVGVRTYDKNKKFVKSISLNSNNATTFTTPNEVEYIRFALIYANNDTTVQAQLEEGSNTTSYEAHKSSILSLPEEVVLRSLPNGVCDTFNTRTGIYTQRIYETTLVGTEEWYLYDTSNANRQDTIAFSINLGLGDVFDNDETYSKIGGIVCDKLNHINSVWGTDKDNEGISADQQNVIVQIKKTRLASENVTGFKAWLASNNLKVGIQLATPIVTKINLPSTLKPWNTTTHIYSEIPENSLYPILSHSNPTYPVILKPSTKYSIIANSYSNNHTNSAINFNLGGATASTTVGSRVTTITTPSTLTSEELVMSGRGNKLNNVMVIEGDVAGDEPYFEGLCDVKSPILSNIGKNLCNVNRYMLACGSGVALNGYKGTVIAKNIKVKPNTTYTFSYGNTVNIPSSAQLKVMTLTDVVDEDIHVDVYTHKNRIYEHSVPNGGSFTTEGGTRYIAITTGNLTTTGDILIEDIEIKEATSPTAYEPYKSNTTTFTSNDDEIIVLRSLPNGVCDILNVKTGEYVQNIGEIICDGSEDERWTYNIGGSEQGKKCFNLPSELTPHRKRYGYIICDCMPTTNTLDKIGVYNGEGLNILIDSDSNDAGVLKEILANKPITVQYQLATPIVKQINVEGYPYAYENGHVLLESGSQEQSLTPTIEYSIVANRGGQIRSNQRMVERHQKKLDSLYAMTLVNMIDSQYKQVLMKLKSELGIEVRTWDIE